MPKRKLLMVIGSLKSGGAEKSLVNLLNELDFNLYEVDLFVFSSDGIFINNINKSVNIIDSPRELKDFMMPLRKSIRSFLIKRRFSMIFLRIFYSIIDKILPQKGQILKWKIIRGLLPRLDKNYHAAVAYSGITTTYYIVDKVKAKLKFGRVATDYMRLKKYYKLDEIYFDKLTGIITVSDSCKKSIENVFPNFSSKIKVIESIIPIEMIHSNSKELIELDNTKYKAFHVITVARLEKVKGIDLAINACERLVKDGYDIKWYVIGAGKEKRTLEVLIDEKDLSENLFLLGEKSNPYPYMRKADVYVQPSRFEGKCNAVNEAKVLCRPIVITNYPSVVDQIEDGKNGVVVPINKDGLYEGIKKLFDNPKIRDELSQNLLNETYYNSDEINKFYQILK